MERFLLLYAEFHLNLYELALARGDAERADECLTRAEEALARTQPATTKGATP